MREAGIRCSFIGLAAEMKILKTIAEQTDGKYRIILHEPHFRDLLLEHVRPPVAKVNKEFNEQ